MEPVPEEGLVGDTGAYGGSRLSNAELETPPAALAYDGRGVPFTHAELAGELGLDDRQIVEAITAQAAWTEELLARLVRAPTTLGNEETGQEVVREALKELGLVPVDVPMDADALRSHPAHSPFDWDVAGKSNVVATWGAGSDPDGRSLILNGHIDVVSPEPRSQWGERDPFSGERVDGWVYGRGAADMKCGLAAILGAVRGLRSLGLSPHG